MTPTRIPTRADVGRRVRVNVDARVPAPFRGRIGTITECDSDEFFPFVVAFGATVMTLNANELELVEGEVGG